MPPAYVTGDPGDVANLDQPDYSNDPVIPYDEDQRITSMQAPAPIVPPPPPQPAPAAPAPAPAATPNLILRGPQGPPPAVSGPPVQMMSPEQAANDFMWRRLSNTVKDLPLAETEQAVSAALRYQGQRQYQQDLASGMSPSEALAKSAPLIFSGPKQSSLGQAASMVRAARPVGPVVRDVGGVLYRFNPDGSATALTPPKAPGPTKLDAVEQGFLKQDLAKLKEVEDDPAFGMPNAKGEELRRRAHDIRNKITIRYRQKPTAPAGSAPPTVSGTTPPPTIPTAPPVMPNQTVNEVRRRTKDGKIAIFDANTRKFIRYAE